MNAEMLKKLKGKVPPKMGVDIKVQSGGKPGAYPGGSPEEEASESPEEAAMEGDTDAGGAQDAGAAGDMPDLSMIPDDVLAKELDRRMKLAQGDQGSDDSGHDDMSGMFPEADEEKMA